MGVYTMSDFIVKPSEWPWGHVHEINIVNHQSTLVSSAASLYTHAYNNPGSGDLILIACFNRIQLITSITYGGIDPTLLASQTADFPIVYLYAISKNNQPAVNQSHNLAVQWNGSNTGATLFAKIKNVSPQVINDVSQITTSSNYVTATSVSTSITVPAGNHLLFDVMACRDGINLNPHASQELLFSGVFDTPRKAAASFRIAKQGTHSMSWSGGVSGNIKHLVAGIKAVI